LSGSSDGPCSHMPKFVQLLLPRRKMTAKRQI